MIRCKDWLRADYPDVVQLIDQAEAISRARGSKQRRNWWEVLAGGSNGRPGVREGIEFPVLRCAQIHESRKVTPNAICRNPTSSRLLCVKLDAGLTKGKSPSSQITRGQM